MTRDAPRMYSGGWKDGASDQAGSAGAMPPASSVFARMRHFAQSCEER